MNRSKLKREGQKWLEKNIITEDQLEEMLSLYPKQDPRFILMIFAVLLMSLGFLTFIFSDWAQVPHISRTLLMVVFMVVLYTIGDRMYRQDMETLGISLIVLGYIMFGVGMLLTVTIYSISLFSAWPFVIWSLIGLLLYISYEHRWLFVIGITVTTIGQIYSGIQFSSFNIIIFLILLLGYAHFTYHQAYRLFGYMFAISYSLQVITLTIVQDQQYYWLIVYFLLLYITGEIILKPLLARSLKHISLLSIFVFGMYQTFLLQESFLFQQTIEYHVVFFIVWVLLMGLVVTLKIKRRHHFELIDLVLFIPVFYLPWASVFSLTILFIFSLAWLLVGYIKDFDNKILLGTTAFLLSTLTAYIQFAWDAINKSLFFIIGGLLLFIISLLIDRQRRRLLSDRHRDV